MSENLVNDSRAAQALIAAARRAVGALLSRLQAGDCPLVVPRPMGLWRHDRRQPFHSHYEWFLPIHGTSVFTCPDGEHRIAPGHTMLVPRGVPHAERVEGPASGFRSLLLCPDPGRLLIIDVGAVARVPVGGKRLWWSNPVFDRLNRYLDDVVQTWHDPGDHARIQARGLLLASAAMLLDGLAAHAPAKPLPAVLRQVMSLIQRRAAEPDLTITDLAKAVDRHPDWLSHCHREATGLTLRQALIARRIDLAKELLSDPTRSLAAVAAASGFRRAGYLIQVFRRHTGYTPGTWRSRCGGTTF